MWGQRGLPREQGIVGLTLTNESRSWLFQLIWTHALSLSIRQCHNYLKIFMQL